jgi:hypothetical protein
VEFTLESLVTWHKTEITKELDFSWATDSIEIYEKRPILHMAGVTRRLKNYKIL